jgi:cytosine/adenosine deaminase-related metal-dependent hydrolase
MASQRAGAAAGGSAGPEGCDLLVRHGYVLTLDDRRTVYPAGAVAVRGSRIVGVGPDAELAARFRPARVLDAQGGAVHPGMIDGHLHATCHLTRTAFSDDPAVTGGPGFAEWFNALTEEDEYASALLASVELVRSGFTAFLEPGTAFEPDTVARAAGAVGVRASVADPFVWDTLEGGNALAPRIERAPATPERAAKVLGGQLWRNRDPEARVRAHVALYGSGSATAELEQAAKRLADEHGVVLNQHQNFMPEQVAKDDARFGGPALARLAELGVLGPNCAFVHMNVLRDEEVEPVVASGMSVVWQPGNFQYYGLAGRMRSRMPELHRRGVNLTLGVDVAKIWTFGELARIAYLVARQGGEYLSAESLLEMETRGGARAMGWDAFLGTLEVGKRADLVVRSTRLAEAQPNLNVVVQLLMLSQARSVDTVVCDGEVVLRRGQLTRLDEEAVHELAQASVRRVTARLGISPRTTWPVRA